jgi:hypothetical protein
MPNQTIATPPRISAGTNSRAAPMLMAVRICQVPRPSANSPIAKA